MVTKTFELVKHQAKTSSLKKHSSGDSTVINKILHSNFELTCRRQSQLQQTAFLAFFFFFFFSEKIRLDSSCELSVRHKAFNNCAQVFRQMIHMECQDLLSLKKQHKTFKMSASILFGALRASNIKLLKAQDF